jgi:hypothetical protein
MTDGSTVAGIFHFSRAAAGNPAHYQSPSAVLIMSGEVSAIPIAPRNDNLKRAATPAVIYRQAQGGGI